MPIVFQGFSFDLFGLQRQFRLRAAEEDRLAGGPVDAPQETEAAAPGERGRDDIFLWGLTGFPIL